MRSRSIRVFVTLLVSLCVASVATAQPGPGPNVAQRRERIKKRVLALRASTLIDELSLDEQSSAKLFPVLAKYDAEFEKLLIARADLNRRLQKAAELDPKAIDKLIDEAAANQRGFWDVEDKRFADLRKVLTPVQMTRLLIVLPALERQIQNQLRRAIVGGPGNRAKELGKNPFRVQPDADTDPDEDDEGLHPPGRTPPVSKPANKPAPQKGPCDPFSNVHGCR
ncbi:MAG: hypothetical protein JWO36_1799 [Myxococcales bacterium]|nr:hypothetical protein [Myxococcales bacterium]